MMVRLCFKDTCISRLGFKIQRAELRASIHRVDHDNTVSQGTAVQLNAEFIVYLVLILFGT